MTVSLAIIEWQFHAALRTHDRAGKMPTKTEAQCVAQNAECDYLERQIGYIAATASWEQIENLTLNTLSRLPADFAALLGYLMPTLPANTLHFAQYLPGHRNNAFTEAFRHAA